MDSIADYIGIINAFALLTRHLSNKTLNSTETLRDKFERSFAQAHKDYRYAITSSGEQNALFRNVVELLFRVHCALAKLGTLELQQRTIVTSINWGLIIFVLSYVGGFLIIGSEYASLQRLLFRYVPLLLLVLQVLVFAKSSINERCLKDVETAYLQKAESYKDLD